ncbi:MAG: class II aldolase/adducin family protein [Burkholderiaceae bacterium]|nr:class II aldolase/adducin family protein [Burkholderiaceae bacterium]
MNDVNTEKLREAAGRLTAKGLLQAGDTLSMRLAGVGKILILSIDTAGPQIKSVELQPAAPAAGSALAVHLTVYRERADVGTVLLNRQPWAAALHELGSVMPGVFDEQIRHLGRSVERLDDALATTGSRAHLGSGANAFVLPGQVLCLGTMLDRAVFNAELLEKCAKAYVLAASTGMKVGKIPWLVRWIANGRLMKDERNAAAQFASGKMPVFSSAY